MTAVVAQVPVISFTDSAGVPLAGGQLYSYVAGTTTPQVTYSDAAGTIPNTNPIVLNARGEALMWFGAGMSYKLVLKDASGNVLWTADGINNAADQLSTNLGATSGSGLVGFDWATLYASASSGWGVRTAANEVSVLRYLAPSDWSSYANGTNTSPIDSLIQPAIDAGVPLFFPPGTYYFGTITPKSGMSLRGVRGLSILKQIQPVTNIATGIYKANGGGSLSNVRISGMTFDGSRVASPGNVANELIGIFLGANETLDGLRIDHCSFQDAQNNFIAIYIASATGYAKNVSVSHCDFTTTAGKRSLGGTATAVSMDGVRLEQTYDYSSAGNAYGTVVYSDIDVSHCRAESIRTLVDYKRGGKTLTATNSRTLNMYDCHHSVDGCFDVTIVGMVGRVAPGYAGPMTGNDFIEVQGERISIAACEFDGQNLVTTGIFLTDYGRTQEGGKGHQCVGVKVENCSILNVTGHAYRALNGISCAVRNCYAENAGLRPVSIESGTSRTDGTNPLQSYGVFVGNVQNRNCGSGVLIGQSSIGSRYAPCPNYIGQDYYDVGTTPPGGTSGGAGNISVAINAPYVNETYRELNANPLMAFYGGTTPLFYTLTSLTTPPVTTGPPNGVPLALTLEDTSGAAIGGMAMNATPLLTQGQVIYSRIQAQYNTSSKWSIQVDELDSSATVLASYYYGTTTFNLVGGGWGEYDLCHTVQNSACAKVRFTLNPAAAAATDAASTGKTNFANWRISRTAIGLI